MVKLPLISASGTPHATRIEPKETSAPAWRWNPDAKLIRTKDGHYQLPNFAAGRTLTLNGSDGSALARVSGLTIPFHLPTELGPELVTALVRGGYLLAPDRFDAHEANVRARIALALHESHGFIIMPTQKCNFRCTYCYESFEVGRMKPDAVEAVSRAIRLKTESVESFALGFFGGEPLMCSDLVLRFSGEAFGAMSRRGLRYGAGVSTNASYLTRDLFERLLDVGVISYQISVDGDRDMHDQQRITVAGRGTFDPIVEHLDAMVDVKGNFVCIVRCNVSQEHFERVVNLFEGPELRRLRNDPRFMVDVHQIWSSDQHTVGPEPKSSGCSISANQQLDYYLLNRRLGDLGMSTVAYGHLPRILSSGCYAGKRNWFIIGPDLALYKCTVVFERPENRIGHVGEDGSLLFDERLNELWTGSNALTDSGCGSCHYRVPCGGVACPLTRFTDGAKSCPSFKSPQALQKWADQHPQIPPNG